MPLNTSTSLFSNDSARLHLIIAPRFDAFSMARRAPLRPRSPVVLSVDRALACRSSSSFIAVVIVHKIGRERAHGKRKPLQKRGVVVACHAAYKQWDMDDMDGALHELSEQFARNTSTCKNLADCKSISQVAKEWNVPHVTLSMYFKSP